MFRPVVRFAAVICFAWLLCWWTMPARAQKPEETPLRVRPRNIGTIGGAEIRMNRAAYYNPWQQQAFALSGDARVAAVVGPQGLRLWDVAGDKDLGFMQSMNGGMNGAAGIAFSPDGKTMVMTSIQPNGQGGCSVKLYEVAGLKHLRDLDEDVNTVPFSAAAFSPDGKTLALAAPTGPQGASIHLWDVASGDEIRRIDGVTKAVAPNPRNQGMTGSASLAFSPNGRTLAVAVDRTVSLWEVATGKQRCVVMELLPAVARDQVGPFGQAFGNGMLPGSSVTSVAFSPDGRTLAASSSEGFIYLWDVITGTELHPLTIPKGELHAVRFSADGKNLLAIDDSNQLLSWAVGAIRRPIAMRKENLPASKLQEAWEDLGSDDRQALSEAARVLVSSPRQTLTLLREKLKPVPAVDSQRITQLVADLSKPEFNERKKAAAELRKLGDLALPALQQAIQTAYDPVKQVFYAKLASQYPTAGQIQALYALHVLERIDDEDARKLLGEMAKGATESMLTQRAKTMLDRPAKTPKPLGRDVKLETLWNELASDDSALALDAVRALAARSKEAGEFLVQQLQTEMSLDDDPTRIAKLIADLDHNDFGVRDQATKTLASIGKAAGPALRKALDEAPNLEVKSRVGTLLERIDKQVSSHGKLQAERALEALEWGGSDESRQALERVNREAKSHWLKQAASQCLSRRTK